MSSALTTVLNDQAGNVILASWSDPGQRHAKESMEGFWRGVVQLIGFDVRVASPTVTREIFKALATWRSRTALLGDEWPGTPGRWAALEATVKGWADLPSNWADDDGRSPPKSVIDGALSFLERARTANVTPAPQVTVDADGEIRFRWRNDKASASACFLPDGHIVAYASQGDGQPLWKLDQRYDDSLDLSSFFERVRSLF